MSKEGSIKVGGRTLGTRDAARAALPGTWTPDDLSAADTAYQEQVLRAREKSAMVDSARAVLKAASGGKSNLRLGAHIYSIADAAWLTEPTTSESVDRYEAALAGFNSVVSEAAEAWAKVEGIEKALLTRNHGLSVIIVPATTDAPGGVYGIYDRQWVGPRHQFVEPAHKAKKS